MKHSSTPTAAFVRQKRKSVKLTQCDLALKAGVGLRFVRELEQGKTRLKMDKVNQVLQLFGQELGPVPIDREQWLAEVESALARHLMTD